jgi:tetratricopeptide (TPR) repeat protein
MVLDPNLAGSISGLALLMERVRKNYVEAEQLYRRALEVDPARIPNIVNFAQFLGARERIDEANEIAVRAWHLFDEVPKDAHAEIALTRWLLDRASGRNGASALGRLKTVLQAGFKRSPWSFDELLAALTPKLVGDDRTLAPKIAEAILDENKVAALEKESIWKAVDPIPLNVRWE